MTGTPARAATSRMPTTSAGLPNRWVTMIARVRSESAAATLSAVTLPVIGSVSANTGTAPS